MNKIERVLYKRLMSGDKKLRSLFESYIRNMGHTEKESKVIVEQILGDDKSIISENELKLSKMAKFNEDEIL